MFGEKLKLARNRAALSLRDLAKEIDNSVSAQAIGRYERGEMLPSSTIAIKLSKSLNVPLSYLFSPLSVKLECVEFRKQKSTKNQDREVEAAVIDHMDRYLIIEDILGLSSHEWNKPAGMPFPVRTLTDAEEAARQVREHWHLGGDPIHNMAQLLEDRGIKVLILDFPLSVDGLTCLAVAPNKEKVPVIVSSANKTVERCRFTLAHELGHMTIQATDSLDEEKACHRFASAFLMPREEVISEFGEQRRHAIAYEEIMTIKHLFGVSAAALTVRLRDLNVITDATMRDIFKGKGRSWRKVEPSPLLEKEEPRRFQLLVLRALAEDLISLAKAAELLRINTTEVSRIMSGPAE